jgi:putative transposase
MCASDSPINKSQLARSLGIANSSLYVQPKRPQMDKALAVRIEQWHEIDDTMGHRKLAALLGTGKNRVERVMHKYGIAARRLRKKYVYPGKASQVAPNEARACPSKSRAKRLSSPIFWRCASPTAHACEAASPCTNEPARLWEWPLTTICVQIWSPIRSKP